MPPVLEGSGWRICPSPKLCLGIILSVCLLAAGCSSHARDESTPGVAIRHEISPDPPQVGTATVTMTLSDAISAPITKAQVGLEADMRHPGMRPHPFGVKELDPGRYQAQVQFDMAGGWVILLHIILQDGNSVERQFDVKGVRPK